MGQATSQSGDPFLGTDTAPFFSPQNTSNSSTRRFRHPWAATFHIAFKTLALLFYLFGGLFGQDFISTFVAVILLISMDFWVVKNVTGRLLAGLRWQNYIDDEGNSHWLFENKNKKENPPGQNRPNTSQSDQSNVQDTADSSIFWTGLIVAPVLWSLLLMVSLFKLNVQWFMLVTLALVLSGSNLYGFTRCRLGTSEVKSTITQFVAKQVFYNFLTGGSSAAKPPV